MAVSFEAKQKALHRDHGCVDPDPYHAGGLEAAHYNHTKDNYERARQGLPPYDHEGSVRILCNKHHLLDHLENRENGLNHHQNRWSISMLIRKLTGL